MKTAQLLVDAFGRIRDGVHGVVAGLDPEQLGQRLDGRSNSIAWLIWHLTRIQDDHLAGASGADQRWTAEGWHGRFGLPFPASATGYGHSTDDVEQVQVASGSLLVGYYDAVHAQTISYVQGLVDDDLDRIVDRAWDPPVTLGVRLVSVINDNLEHVGQAAFLRGLIAAPASRPDHQSEG
jgi:uncharacterized damage-inducible protein DinB